MPIKCPTFLFHLLPHCSPSHLPVTNLQQSLSPKSTLASQSVPFLLLSAPPSGPAPPGQTLGSLCRTVTETTTCWDSCHQWASCFKACHLCPFPTIPHWWLMLVSSCPTVLRDSEVMGVKGEAGTVGKCPRDTGSETWLLGRLPWEVEGHRNP
jgi:hypothetical protein